MGVLSFPVRFHLCHTNPAILLQLMHQHMLYMEIEQGRRWLLAIESLTVQTLYYSSEYQGIHLRSKMQPE